jgi:MatE
MTTYPLEFHRRSERKWVLRVQASSACESTPRAAESVGSQREQRRSGESERRDILARRPWLRELFFLGRLGTNALAGASLAFPWVMLVLQTTNSRMGSGVSSAVARALGAGRRDRADDLVFHAFLLALALAAIFSTVTLLGAPFSCTRKEEMPNAWRGSGQRSSFRLAQGHRRLGPRHRAFRSR